MDKITPGPILHTLSQSARDLITLSLRKTYPDSDEESLQIFRDRDNERNQETTPPDDEMIDLCCMWAIEYYTPSHRSDLVKGLERLGWDQEAVHRRQDIEDWVDSFGQPAPGIQGSWLNLGFIRETGTNDMTFGKVHSEAMPPPGVRQIGGRLISITSSLACVVMAFLLDDENSRKLDSTLRKDRQTFYESTTRVRTIYEPETQKINDIRQIRDETKRVVTNWFSSNMPGLFSSGLLDGNLPTWEFVTLCTVEPFPDPQHRAPYFLRLLGLESFGVAWTNQNIPGLKFSLRNLVNSSPQFHSIISMKESSLSDEFLEDALGWSGRDARIRYVDDCVQHGCLLQVSALLQLLEGYGNHLRAVRDTLALNTDTRQNPVAALENMSINVSFSVDIDAVTSELLSFVEPESWNRLRLPAFVPNEPESFPEGFTFSDSLRFAIEKRASWIQKTDNSLRDHCAHYGALVGGMENVRLQRQIKYFTIALTVLTFVLLSEASLVQSFFKELNDLLQDTIVLFKR